MENVSWIVFPKPHRDIEKCKKWVHACGRANFTAEKVNKWTYICSKHFVGGNGPTAAFPDPIPASFTPIQTEKYSRKRKPPTPRANPVSKNALLEASEALLSLQDAVVPSAGDQLNVTEQTAEQEPEPSTTDDPTKDFGVNTEPVQTNDKESQTMYACKEKLAMKIDNVINRNSAEVPAEEKVLPQFCLEEISKNEKQFKFYTGLTIAQFEHLFSSLGESVNTLIYWRGEKRTNEKTPTPAKRPSEIKISPKNQLLITLMRLRQAFPKKDIAYRF